MRIELVENDRQKQDAFQVRRLVFIEEQNVPEDREHDEFDETALHLVGYLHEKPVAAARIQFKDDYGKLERICVLKSERGSSYGRQLIQYMEDVISSKSCSKVKLNSQTHAEGFYKLLGYQTISDSFIDAGIPHVTMMKDLH
ncbi:GNAT family N-acetyltransferase [Halobacillus rhizosphaerae]|uniref:GNAT family N-acetyltransferase n=1 Tax=Halobacillus rhizosphaerae TaxID=3064889 RepID=UPI00398A5B71